MGLVLAPVAHAGVIHQYSVFVGLVRVEFALPSPLAANLSAQDITSEIQDWRMRVFQNVDDRWTTGPDDPGLYAFRIRVSTAESGGISAWSFEIATIVPPYGRALMFCSAASGSGRPIGQYPGGVCEAGFGRGEYTNLSTPNSYWPHLSKGDWTRRVIAACRDGFDNDRDGFVDFPDDPGCADAESDNESPECSDGLDNDVDGHADYPNDPECRAAFGLGEAPCNDGIDNDGDGLVDYQDDLGCDGPHEHSERAEPGSRYQCDDGIDNDGDGSADSPDDPGCPISYAAFENPQCDDGVDNDGDGLADFDDPNCAIPNAPYWESAPCGIGAELALVMPLLGLAANRRATRRVRHANPSGDEVSISGAEPPAR